MPYLPGVMVNSDPTIEKLCTHGVRLNTRDIRRVSREN